MHDYRADNAYLVLLLCTSGVFAFVSRFKRALLLLSGNIEFNPGRMFVVPERQLLEAISILPKL